MADYEFFRVERAGQVLTIALDRPRVHNSLHAPAGLA
jgi:enoyl-CoA hydratase/carnithine racemase